MERNVTKNLKKILGIFILLIVFYNNFSYADIIVDFRTEMDDFRDLTLNGLLICGGIVFVISIISFILLKFTSSEEVDKEKLEKGKRRIYVWVMIFTVVGHFWCKMKLDVEYNVFAFWIPIIMFVISILVRKKLKSASNIICAISIMIISIMAMTYFIIGKVNENYYNKFIDVFDGSYTSVVEVINNVIETNEKNGEKISIYYNGNHYSTVKELNNLLKEIVRTDEYDIHTLPINKYNSRKVIYINVI